MRLLIYGAGVIGSLYASLFSRAGFDTTIYARGRRLKQLNRNGLLYEKAGKIRKASVHIISALDHGDSYDFIFLPVRETQVLFALEELSHNISPNVVTMVNTLEFYGRWEEICGKGRIIPAFPGAGGGFDEDVLKAALTPRALQPTTFGEINGQKTKRLSLLAEIFRQSKIPYEIVKDMHIWQLCHLAMVVPIAEAYYEAAISEKAWLEKNLMRHTAARLKRNFRTLHKKGVRLSPVKLNLFRFLPVTLLSFILRLVFRSDFGIQFLYRHAMKAPDEMRQLQEQLRFNLYPVRNI